MAFFGSNWFVRWAIAVESRKNRAENNIISHRTKLFFTIYQYKYNFFFQIFKFNLIVSVSFLSLTTLIRMNWCRCLCVMFSTKVFYSVMFLFEFSTLLSSFFEVFSIYGNKSMSWHLQFRYQFLSCGFATDNREC